jgi:hypothetical protein
MKTKTFLLLVLSFIMICCNENEGSLPEQGLHSPHSASKPYVTVSRHTAPQ